MVDVSTTSIHPKVSAAAFGGLLVALAAAILGGLGVSASLTTCVAAITGWLVPAEKAA